MKGKIIKSRMIRMIFIIVGIIIFIWFALPFVVAGILHISEKLIRQNVLHI